VILPISTPALMFPAVSLLFLSYTNRFLHLSALIRTLHSDWLELRDNLLLDQITNLRRRLVLIRWMQLLGALSLFCSVASMLAVAFSWQAFAMGAFIAALSFMAVSLAGLTVEIWISGGALKIMLASLEKECAKTQKMKE